MNYQWFPQEFPKHKYNLKKAYIYSILFYIIEFVTKFIKYLWFLFQQILVFLF